MITTKQYTDALITIDQYHRQHDHKNDKRLTISAFITDLEKTPFKHRTRIINVLEILQDRYVFLDAITKDRFHSIMNAGKKSFLVFREKQILALQSKKLNTEK